MSVLQDFLLLMICQVSKMKEILSSVNSVMQECTNPRHQVTWATKFCTVAPDIFGIVIAVNLPYRQKCACVSTHEPSIRH